MKLSIKNSVLMLQLKSVSVSLSIFYTLYDTIRYDTRV